MDNLYCIRWSQHLHLPYSRLRQKDEQKGFHAYWKSSDGRLIFMRRSERFLPQPVKKSFHVIFSVVINLKSLGLGKFFEQC